MVDDLFLFLDQGAACAAARGYAVKASVSANVVLLASSGAILREWDASASAVGENGQNGTLSVRDAIGRFTHITIAP